MCDDVATAEVRAANDEADDGALVMVTQIMLALPGLYTSNIMD